MHTPEDMTPAHKELESALRSLHPEAVGVDAVGMAFRLGEAAGARRLRGWQASAGMCAMMALAAVVVSIMPRSGVAISGGANAPRMAAGADPGATEAHPGDMAAAPRAPAPIQGLYLTSSYMRLRERSLRMGAGALGEELPPSSVEAASEGTRSSERLAPRQSELDLFMQALRSGGRL